MSGTSIETMLDLWAPSLLDAKLRIRLLFTRERVAASAGLFLDGLLGDERRKTRLDTRRGGRRPRGRGASRPSWAAADGTRMRCAMLCWTMSSSTWRPMTRF